MSAEIAYNCSVKDESVQTKRAHPWSQARQAGVARLLHAAAHILQERGWVRGVSVDQRSGRIDIQGAVCLAAKIPIHRITEESVEELVQYAPQRQRGILLLAWELLDGALQEEPVTWNDAPDRTVEEVVGALENLADLLEIAF